MSESLLVIDKAVGPTSFDVVRAVKKLVRGEKVGHTGSLDPFASGVLVLLLGRATKLSNVLLNADKRYRAICRLGVETDTLDRTGEPVETAPVPELTPEAIRACLEGFVGEWMQTPPMYSAKKVKGVRLYELARQNIAVRRQPIPVQLYEMKFLSWEAPDLHFEVHCSKGTYIRSLAGEIGRKLGTVGHLAELRRLSCGEFKLDEAVTVEALGQDLTKGLLQGHRNYARLLRSEGITRRPGPLPRPHLPRSANDGNSLLNQI